MIDMNLAKCCETCSQCKIYIQTGWMLIPYGVKLCPIDLLSQCVHRQDPRLGWTMCKDVHVAFQKQAALPPAIWLPKAALAVRSWTNAVPQDMTNSKLWRWTLFKSVFGPRQHWLWLADKLAVYNNAFKTMSYFSCRRALLHLMTRQTGQTKRRWEPIKSMSDQAKSHPTPIIEGVFLLRLKTWWVNMWVFISILPFSNLHLLQVIDRQTSFLLSDYSQFGWLCIADYDDECFLYLQSSFRLGLAVMCN